MPGCIRDCCGESDVCGDIRRSNVLNAQNSSTKSRQQKFQWRVPIAHFETVNQELVFDGEIKQELDAKGVPLLYVFVGVALLPYLAKAIIALVKDIIYGGVIVDTRGETIKIYTDKSLPTGATVVVRKNETIIIERNEITGPTELIEAISK